MQSVRVINVTHHMNRIKEENNDFCVDVKQSFDQVQ